MKQNSLRINTQAKLTDYLVDCGSLCLIIWTWRFRQRARFFFWRVIVFFCLLNNNKRCTARNQQNEFKMNKVRLYYFFYHFFCSKIHEKNWKSSTQNKHLRDYDVVVDFYFVLLHGYKHEELNANWW